MRDAKRSSWIWSVLLFVSLIGTLQPSSPRNFVPASHLSHARLSASLRLSLISRRAQDDADTDTGADWREFRARLVQQESGDVNSEQGWAHATPLIETGSLLLSAPGDHFALGQQYFHKTVIFIVSHSDDFTQGVILNRPTAFNTSDLESLLGSELISQLSQSSTSEWNVWCGGDCQGLSSRDQLSPVSYCCLHTVERFANKSKQIIKGVFVIDLALAKELVVSGEADKDDFLLLVGYCGWGPGQLQGELDRGDTWTLAAADRKALLGRLREAQAALTTRLEAALTRRQEGKVVRPLTAEEVGDGLEEWRRLYAALGSNFSKQLEDEGSHDVHTDDMLRLWVERHLIPQRYQASSTLRDSTKLDASDNDELDGEPSGVPNRLEAGTILRGSPTAWLLGKPIDSAAVGDFGVRQVPGQYLHKSVLVIAGDVKLRSLVSSPRREPALLVLLTGPEVGQLPDSKLPVYFGGPVTLGQQGVFELRGADQQHKFQGMIALDPNDLAELLRIRALEIVDDVRLSDVLSVPVSDRWQAAGGKIESLNEALTASRGDIQLKKWYQRFLGMNFPPGS